MNVKLLIAYHKKSALYKDDILTPIHVGRKNANKDSKDYPWLIENMIGDDTGDNISEKNPSYNELTALYWAWKNYDRLGNPDYIGLMHYRRHLIFDPNDQSIVKQVGEHEPNYLDSLHYSKENIEKLLSGCDFIYNRGRVSSIYEQYKLHHRIQDLELAVKIVKEKYPEYRKTADEYLTRSTGCFANMFIFPKDMFFRYCEWLFSILAEFESQVDLTNRRLFISERLTGIFVQHELDNGKIGLPLSSTFVAEPLKVDVASMVTKETLFQTAVLINSIVDTNRYPKLKVTYHLFHYEKDIDETRLGFINNEIVELDWVYVDEKTYRSPLFPLKFGEILPKVGKLLFLDINTLVFASMDVIWEACNTFEFMTVYSGENADKVFCINLKLFRYYDVASLYKDESEVDAIELLKEKYPEQQMLMAPWVMYYVTNEKDGYGLYEGMRRSELEDRVKVWTVCMLHYENGLEPWENLRCCFAIYWWDKAERVPASVPFLHLDEKALVEQVSKTNVTFNANLKQCQIEHEQRLKEQQQLQQQPKAEKVGFPRRVYRKIKRLVKKVLGK